MNLNVKLEESQIEIITSFKRRLEISVEVTNRYLELQDNIEMLLKENDKKSKRGIVLQKKKQKNGTLSKKDEEELEYISIWLHTICHISKVLLEV